LLCLQLSQIINKSHIRNKAPHQRGFFY